MNSIPLTLFLFENKALVCRICKQNNLLLIRDYQVNTMYSVNFHDNLMLKKSC